MVVMGWWWGLLSEGGGCYGHSLDPSANEVSKPSSMVGFSGLKSGKAPPS